MKHPGADALGAYVDGGLSGRAREETERHLATCEACRAEVESMRALDADLERALTHDPGEAYFESFAGRVEQRIRAEAAPARPRSALARWLGSPRRLAAAGALAVVVVGGGLVLLVARERPAQGLREPAAVSRALDLGAGPAPTAAPEADADRSADTGPTAESAPALGDDADDAGTFARAPRNEAVPGRAYEVRRDARGEDVPVDRANRFRAAAPAPPPAPPVEEGVGVRVVKPQRAEPLDASARRERAASPTADEKEAPAPSAAARAAKSLAAPAPAPAAGRASLAETREAPRPSGDVAAAIEVCGTVRDRAGRAVAGARVSVAETGASARTDADGRFCLASAPGPRTLTALAIGYDETRRAVAVSDRLGEVAIVLEPVDVVGAPPPPARRDGAPAAPPAAEQASEPEDAYSVLPDASRAIARAAQREAARGRDALRAGRAAAAAQHFDRAAARWSELLPEVAGERLELDARLELALARFDAWEAEPRAPRAGAAEAALRDYLVDAPSGAARRRAEDLLARLPR